MIFKKKKLSLEVEEYRFDAMMSLIKDLPRADYNRLKKAMDLGYDAYQTVRNVKTVDEREVEDIEKIDKSLKEEI
jgi:hypothetical protein